MANNTYMAGRKKYKRPQAILWADNAPTYDSGNGLWLPQGDEVGLGANNNDNFIILSDHGRQALDFSTERIEKRERMINGRMRSYHIADKLSLSVSWNLLPSRGFSLDPAFNSSGAATAGTMYTVDGGAGGTDILEWYEKHTGSFWVLLAYDKHDNFPSNEYGRLAQYNEAVEMFFSDFSYTVEKRGGNNYDFWNITVKLEEV
jgi:hypothetical protein